MTIGLPALIASAIFTGAAVYVNVAEQPARLTLDDGALLREWKPSHKRGAAMQAPLALLGFLLGLIGWWRASHSGFLIGAIAMIAPWPWTLIGIKPINDALLATAPDQAGPQTRADCQMGRPARRSRRARHRCVFVGMYVAPGAYTRFSEPPRANSVRSGLAYHD